MTDDELAAKMVENHIATMSKMTNDAVQRMADKSRMVMDKMLQLVNPDDEASNEKSKASGLPRDMEQS